MNHKVSIQKGAVPNCDESATVDFLIAKGIGRAVIFLAPSGRPYAKSPDILMDGKKLVRVQIQ